jgi:hypothetical protein
MSIELISSLIIATATACGVLIALFKYVADRRRAEEISFIQWFTSFSETFRTNTEFQSVRVQLVSNKDHLFKSLIGVWDHFDIPEKQGNEWRRTFSDYLTNTEVDWPTIRMFADYLHFFEEMLIISERLASQGQKRHADLIKERFSWYYGLLATGWGLSRDKDTQGRMSAFVISYIKNGGYDRLYKELRILNSKMPEYV